MSRMLRARIWFGEHPTAADGCLTVAVTLASLALFLIGPDQALHSPMLWSPLVPLTVVSSALLVLRRTHTTTVWIATTALGLAAVLIYEGSSPPAYAPAIVALYTLATRSPLRLTVLATVVTALAPAAFVVAQEGSSVLDAFVYGLTAWSGLAAASGLAVRNERAVVAAAHERAHQAEAAHEEESQRRVAEERLRIARELHDVVAHHISVINVQAGVAAHLVRSDPAKAVEALGHVREASQIVLREVPGLLGLLRTAHDQLERSPAPRLSDADDLVEAARRSGLDLTWRISGSPAQYSPSADLTVYRVLQEALTNAARHGSGRALAVLFYDAGGLTLEVCNERSKHAVATPKSERHGLAGMRERVAAVGGQLTVGPQGTRHWMVRVRVPAEHPAIAKVS